ncbi:MBL fold metallo-hydrolase [Desulfurococcus mucosus]|uniref:RNA-metabolising metallo-beta-lactamase n=1 Tax=Desulfurococcus mucosus (strain ATCC 35584 / DSM 2162 / JCM 9187 / O7/1) TaxID=765177 RepID=E8R7D6_DESM0|nr:MBL fold metallo-hydrolase [Desulfurococcus mucosus]ADV65601.1 RNA-metabolising metallo-beta-lactamase [Desulfurococcus mucosus DSM 2162]
MKIKVLGGGREVGRAAYLVEDGSQRFLLDYGVNFDERDMPRLPQHVRPVDVSGLIVSHAHLDHVGAAPYLYITGRPKAFSTKPTLEVARLLTMDFLKLNAAVIEYDMREFENLYDNTVFLDYGETYEEDGFKLVFANAGHIIGSSITYLETGSGRRLMYTGDINDRETWTLPGAETLETGVETVIVESTYGGRNHPPRHVVEKRLLEIVEETIDRKGTVLIPAFSVGRSQEIAALIASEAPYIEVYLDGMIKDITDIYLRYRKYLRDPALFNKVFETVNFVTGTRDRKKIINKPCVIIASAGMLKGGPSVYYLKKLHQNPRNSIIMVSYQAPNSNGHKLLEAGEIPELEVGRVNARVEWLDFSSHAGQKGLVDILSRYKSTVRDIIIVHGGEEEAFSLREAILEELGSDVRIHVPNTGDEIDVA